MIKFTFSKMAVFALIAAIALSLAPTAHAQSGDYVPTFSLPKTPADGAYKGIDASGATITYWHNQTATNNDALNALADTFNKNNPWKITIKPVAKGSYPVIYQAMLGALQTKELPNLTVAYQNEAATYQTANALVDQNLFVNDATFGLGDKGKADFFPGFLNQDLNPQYNGARLGFPLYRSIEVLYYNADALKALGYTAPPKTWAEFSDMTCKFAKQGGGKTGYEARTDASWIAAAAFAQGGNIYDTATGKFTYNTPEAQIGPATVAQLVSQGCASIIANGGDQADFAAGKSLFYAGSSSGQPYIKKAISDAKGTFAFNIAPLPYKDHPTMNIYGASVSVVKTTPRQELASWLFLRWFSETDQQATWVSASNYYPVRQSAAAKLTDLFAKLPSYKSGFDLLSGGTKAEPPLAGYNPIRDSANAAFNDVLDGQDVKARFAKLNDDANKLVSDFKPNLVPATPKPAATKAATMSATMASTMSAATMAATK